MSNLQQDYAFEDYTEEELDQSAAQQAGKGSGKKNYVQVKEGENQFRVLPKLKGEEAFIHVSYHFVDGPDGKTKIFPCPRIEAREECPACAQAFELRKSKNSADQELSKRWMPKARTFCSVIDRSQPEAGPLVYAFGQEVWGQINDILHNPKIGGQTILRPGDDGRDIIVMRKGMGKFDTEYTVTASHQPSAFSEDDGEAYDWLEAREDLEQFAILLPAEKIDRLLSGGGGRSRGGGGGGRTGQVSGGQTSGGRSQSRPQASSRPAAGRLPKPAAASSKPASGGNGGRSVRVKLGGSRSRADQGLQDTNDSGYESDGDSVDD